MKEVIENDQTPVFYFNLCVALCNKCADHARQSVSLVCTAQVKQRRQLLRMIMLVSMSCVFYGFSYLLHYKIKIRPDIESFHISPLAQFTLIAGTVFADHFFTIITRWNLFCLGLVIGDFNSTLNGCEHNFFARKSSKLQIKQPEVFEGIIIKNQMNRFSFVNYSRIHK